MFAALKAGAPLTHLVTVELPGYTIRWLLGGGFVPHGGHVYQARDATYGTLSSIGEIADGVGDNASPVEIVINPPTLASLADMAAVDAQGGLVTVQMAAVDRNTGLVIGTPYTVHVGRLDRPSLTVKTRQLVYDIITTEAWGLEPNEDQRQSDAFHQDIWIGEKGYEFQTDGTKQVFWREDDPNNAIGFISARRKKGGDPLEFNYETDAGWPFPFGRTNVKGTINARFGFGPTNRYQTILATVAASGPINAFVSFTANDELTTFGADGIALDGDHDGAMWLQRKLGTQPQAALTVPASIGETPAPWTSAHAMSGKACFALTMFENSKKTEFSGGVPTIEHVVEGLKGWDSREVGCDLAVPSTWIYITDGPTAALNWAIGRWEGASGGGLYGVPYLTKLVGGIGSPLEGIDVAAHVAAANIADANGWTVSHCPTSADDKHQVRKELLQSAACEPALICGRISLVCNGAPLTSLMTVTNADTAGDVTIDLQPSRLDRRNVALPKFKSEEHRWEMTSLQAIGNPDWITEDGGRRATGPRYPTISDKDQCAQITYLDEAHARALTGEAPFKPYMMAVEPGQAFTWQEPEYLLVDVKVQVRTRSYDPMKGVAKFGFRRERDANYTEAMAQVGIAPTDAVPEAPPPTYVEPPTDFAGLANGTNADLTWRNPTSELFDFCNLHRGTSTVFSSATIVDFYAGAPGEMVSVTNTPPSAGTYRFWVTAVDFEGNASAPVGPVSVTVTTASPSPDVIFDGNGA